MLRTVFAWLWRAYWMIICMASIACLVTAALTYLLVAWLGLPLL